MVTVSKGRAIVYGDTVDFAIDIVTFLGSINKIKEEDYGHYKALELALKTLCEEENESIDIIKEFAINMTEIFN